MSRLTTLLYAALLTAPAAAADEPKIELKETYWQRPADVGGVTLDTNRNPVFHLKDGFYFSKTGKFVAYPKDASWANPFIDRTGRVWCVSYNQSTVQLWTGTAWESLKHHPVRLFEDSQDRVFLFDGHNVRVLGTDGKWVVQAITEKRHSEGVHFVESGKRVWLWGSRELPGGADGMLGAWSLADGKWTRHDTKSGLPFDSVHWMHPLADGRFVMLEDRPPGGAGAQPVFWHPDRKLKDDEKSVFRDPNFRTQGGDPATGIDGTLYVGAARGFKGGLATISPKGEVGFLTNREERLDRLPQANIQWQNVVFANPGEPPPVLPHTEGGFLGADRDGRYYYRAAGSSKKNPDRTAGVAVVWPKHEKPGDVLRLEKEKVAMTRVVKDEAGKVWAEQQYGGGLFQWHRGKWLETPVLPLYHPAWTARPASPWNDWTSAAARLVRVPGKDGALLVVRVRDVYQTDEPPGGEFVPPRAIRDPNFPHPAPAPGVPAAGEKPKYWLEAFLFRGGKWSGPTDLRRLLASESAALLADFPTAAGEMSYCAFVNDGARLWVAFDGKVLTGDKTGKVIEADWPLEKPKHPLPFVMLSATADGKVVLSGTLGDGHALAVSPEGKVVATDFAMPGGSPAANPNDALAHWKLAKDGTLWYWTETVYKFGARVWHLRDGRWAEKKGLGAPFHEDADGNLWCHPEPRLAGKLRVLVASGTRTNELDFPQDEWKLGVTAIPKGAVAWASDDHLYCVEPGGPGGRPVLRWRLLTESIYGHAPAVTDAKGTVLFGAFRGELAK
jgi:hypothetical protein